MPDKKVKPENGEKPKSVIIEDEKDKNHEEIAKKFSKSKKATAPSVRL